MLDSQVLEYRTGSMALAEPSLRDEIAKKGIRPLMRSTGLSQHTIERALRQEIGGRRGNGPRRVNVFEDGMLHLITGLVGVALLFQATIPLAHFTGTVHGVTKKQITIETAESNLVEFEINRKTRIQRGGKNVSESDLKTGDSVTIEAKQEMLRYLVAVTISVEAKPDR